MELKSKKGQDVTQCVFSLEETAYSYNAQHNRTLAVNRMAHSKSCSGSMLCRKGYKR